jgi:hypothetical protein
MHCRAAGKVHLAADVEMVIAIDPAVTGIKAVNICVEERPGQEGDIVVAPKDGSPELSVSRHDRSPHRQSAGGAPAVQVGA